MTPSIATRIVTLAHERFELFHDEAREAWAWDGTDAHRIGSAAFAERLGADFFESTGKVASSTSLSTAATTLRGIARWEGPEIPVALRIAGQDGSVVVDLADARHQLVLIGPDGWEVTTESPVRFFRPVGMKSLPLPEKGGSLDAFADLWPIHGDDLVLVMGWVLGCFNPSGSKPLLDLSGTQGSGKSLLARMLGALVDPNAIPLQTMPSDLRNLAVMAQRHAVLAFDNVSTIANELSDALCRLSTGGGFETRKLYTDDDLVSFTAIRPVAVTGIPEVAKQSDLVDRTISVVHDDMGPDFRRTEAEVLADFEAVRPRVLGLLFDAVSCALARVSDVVLDDAPRMLDFVTWVEAGAPAFGWQPGRFLDAYIANRKQASVGVLEGSFVGRFVPALAVEGFDGTATECLARLAVIAGPEATRNRAWPPTPGGLAGILRRLAPALREAGIVVEFEREGHDRRRVIRIVVADHPPGVAAVLPLDVGHRAF
jgi:hypothetical protein